MKPGGDDEEPQEYTPLLDSKVMSASRPASCRSIFQAEFKIKAFLFDHPHKQGFYTCQLPVPKVVFAIYRWLVALYFLAWMLTTIALMEVPNGFPWPVWLTNWTYTMVTLHLVTSAIITTFQTSRIMRRLSRGHGPLAVDSTMEVSQSIAGSISESNEIGFVIPQPPLPWYMKFSWFVWAIVSNFTFIVTVVYFAVLYPMLDIPYVSIFDFHLHGLTSIVILIEILFTQLPVRLLHMVYPILYGLIYVIFSAIYWAVDHDNVLYPNVLDWNKPGTTVIVILILGFVVIPLLQLLIFLLYRARLCLFKSCTHGPGA